MFRFYHNTNLSLGHIAFLHQMSEALKKDKVDEVLRLKADIAKLIHNVRLQTAVCQKYENENQYLQDYIGSVMQSGDLK